MPLGWGKSRVAEIICTVAGGAGQRIRVSGYRITADKVLTCAHDVERSTTIQVRFNAGPAEHSSADEWSVTAKSPILLGHDLAILFIDPAADPKNPALYTPAYGRITPGLVNPVAHAVGFPRGQARSVTSISTEEKIVYRESKQATGALNTLSGMKKRTWELAVSNRLPGVNENCPSSWEGMSGAAVWVNGCLVGVVTEDVHPDLANILTITPLAALWQDPPEQLKWPLNDLFNCEHPAVWDELAVDPSLQHVLSDHHARVYKIIPRGGVEDRGRELALMFEFCRPDGDESYWWWRAGPWHGKTALMAAFATTASPDLCVASFFLNAQYQDRRTSDKFLETVLPQLDAIAGRPHRSHLTEGAEEETFQRILAETAKICHEHGARLVLLIDALDEEDWHPYVQSRPSIASLLPASPSAGLRIVISSRPNPELPTDVPLESPLRTVKVRHDLAESRHARQVERRALEALERLDLANGLEWRAIALIAVAGSGLSSAEVADILEEQPSAVKYFMTRSTLLLGQDRHFGSDAPETVWTLAHTTLPGSAKKILAKKRVREYQQRINQWADSYMTAGWPPDTPRFLLSNGYTAFLSTQDLDRLTQLALDRARLARLLTLTGSTLQVYEDIRAAEQANLESQNPDIGRALRLWIDRVPIEKLTPHIPTGLPAVYAYVGQHHRALTLAKSITDSRRRTEALTGMALAQARAGDEDEVLATAAQTLDSRDRAQILIRVATVQKTSGHNATLTLDRALVTAEMVSDPSDRARTLAEVATVQATSGHDPTLTLAKALDAVGLITDPRKRAHVLAQVATAQATSGHDPTLTLAETLDTAVRNTDDWDYDQTLTEVVRAQAIAGTFQDAWDTADDITDPRDRAQAWAEMATVQANRGYDPSLTLVEALDAARQITDLTIRDQGLIAVVRAQTAAIGFGPFLQQALDTAGQITNPHDRVRALAEVATTQASSGYDPTFALAEALDTAFQITDSKTRDQALIAVVKAQATTGTFRQALDTAGQIISPMVRTRALSTVVVAQVAADALQSSLDAAFQKALDTAFKISAPNGRAWALTEVARAQAAAGHDPTPLLQEALSPLFQAVLAPAQSIAQSEALCAKAIVQAMTGDHAGALTTVLRIPNDSISCPNEASMNRDEALTAVARAQALASHHAQALNTAYRVTSRNRAQALCVVARSQVSNGDQAQALATAFQITASDTRARTLIEVAIAQASMGQDPTSILSEASDTALQVNSPYGRAQVLIEVAIAQAIIGLDPTPTLSEVGENARDLTHDQYRFSIFDQLSDAESFAQVTVQVAVGAFRDALRTAHQISDSERRALALSEVGRVQAISGVFEGALGTARQIAAIHEGLSRTSRLFALAKVVAAQLEVGCVAKSIQICEVSLTDRSEIWHLVANMAFEKRNIQMAIKAICMALQRGNWRKSMDIIVIIYPDARKVIDKLI